jgi:tetratricopeptide (TPR) repeat protein
LPEPERQAASANGSCIHCHMPPLPSHDIPHTALTDHRILTQPKGRPARSESDPADGTPPAPAGGPPRLNLFLEADMSKEAIDRARGLLLAVFAANRSDPKLAIEALRQFKFPSEPGATPLDNLGNDVEVLERAGVLFVLLNQPEPATRIWQRVLELDPTNERVLHYSALFRLKTGDHAGSLTLFDQLITENPHLAEYHWLRASAQEKVGRMEDAIRSAERTLELDPTAIPIRDWLAQAYDRAGRSADADRQRQVIARMKNR